MVWEHNNSLLHYLYLMTDRQTDTHTASQRLCVTCTAGSRQCPTLHSYSTTSAATDV